MTKLAKYSFGTGDRFAHQAAAQLSAIVEAAHRGIQIDIVWNKSYREHNIIGSDPGETRAAADDAVSSYRDANPDGHWTGRHFLDADHIRRDTVDGFLPYAEFYTLDVADYIGNPGAPDYREKFLSAAEKWVGKDLEIPGLPEALRIKDETLNRVADMYLDAVRKAGELYRYIAEQRKGKDLIIEVSMDETSQAQSPGEIFLILLALSMEDIPLQTFAPRFSGRFNKGVQYVGDPGVFEREFESDALVLRYAAERFNLPENLKLSLHSGSDKFAIYAGINRVLKRHDLGLHVKTAGTTWLEELIGLCESGTEGADFVRSIYRDCLDHMDELTAPYAEVIDIDPARLPAAEELDGMEPAVLAELIRHDNGNPRYNPSLRQLFHVGYKIAAGRGEDYLSMLRSNREVIAEQVKTNLLERHILKIWV